MRNCQKCWLYLKILFDAVVRKNVMHSASAPHRVLFKRACVVHTMMESRITEAVRITVPAISQTGRKCTKDEDICFKFRAAFFLVVFVVSGVLEDLFYQFFAHHFFCQIFYRHFCCFRHTYWTFFTNFSRSAFFAKFFRRRIIIMAS